MLRHAVVIITLPLDSSLANQRQLTADLAVDSVVNGQRVANRGIVALQSLRRQSCKGLRLRKPFGSVAFIPASKSSSGSASSVRMLT